MENIIGEVTQDDINRARRDQPGLHCVVATTLRRMFPHEDNIRAGYITADIGDNEYDIDNESSKHISKWMRGFIIKPFRFTLTPWIG